MNYIGIDIGSTCAKTAVLNEKKEIIRELKQLLKGNNHGTSSDRALLLDYQATMETKPEKAIKLEKEALA